MMRTWQFFTKVLKFEYLFPVLFQKKKNNNWINRTLFEDISSAEIVSLEVQFELVRTWFWISSQI